MPKLITVYDSKGAAFDLPSIKAKEAAANDPARYSLTPPTAVPAPDVPASDDKKAAKKAYQTASK